jgi:DNA polymerase (family 10)
MPRANDTVAALLEEYADLLSITGGEAFKARSYEKAARAIAGHHADVTTLDLPGLQEIPSVGKSIAEKVVEYLRTGQVAAVEALRAKIPAGVRAMTAVPGLGPRKAMILYTELHISSVTELEEAIREDRLADLRGFGKKTAQNLLQGIEQARGGAGRVQIDVATGIAEEIIAELTRLTGCTTLAYAGSLRRMKETIGDVDILVASAEAKPIMDAFAGLDVVADIIAKGEKKTSIRTRRGLQVDLRVVPPESWGAALQYFTGSKEHNVRIREMAVRRGLKLSEYGLHRVEDGSLVVSETEEEVYRQLGLDWIAPPLREDRGEVDAAAAGALPRLVTLADIKGDLHTHTSLTDGVSPLAEMVAAAKARRLRWYAVTDHAKNLPMQRMTDEKMLAQRIQVRELDVPGITVLHGTELNIDPDGEVDWDGDFLAGFDVCVASVHSHFTQPSPEMTRRYVRACENPYVNIIGHPTTRQIGRRPGVEPDWDAIFEAAAATGTAMEINAHPDRLDLSDDLVLRAKRHGVVFALNTDAHSTVHLDNLRYGIGVAQRAWLTPDDVLTTWPLNKVKAFVAAKRPAKTPARRRS